jgi:hypothetical protein
LIVDLFCVNTDSTNPFKSTTIHKNRGNNSLSVGNWKTLLEPFSKCPHPLKGKTLKVASAGTNPFIFTDYDQNIVYTERGRPIGTNTGIVESIGKALNFDVDITPLSGYDYYDHEAKKWVGMTGQVR